MRNSLKVLELFAGIGACSKALTNLGIDYEIVDAVEIDKYAIKSFNAIHGTNFEPQDIREWDKDVEVDLIMHGSPCQDFSIAGKQAGGDRGSGTRSSLMYETLRIVKKLKPKYVVWENVKNILSQRHVHNWDAYAEYMEELGYTNYCQVLNAKDYGIPQNRERVFTISIKNYFDVEYNCDLAVDFNFPEPFPLTLRLKDFLEDDVDEKYYVKKTNNLVFGKKRVHWDNSGKGYGSQQDRAVYENGLSPTLSRCNSHGDKAQVCIVASRGRNPQNPSDKIPGDHRLEQRLEPRFDGMTNTITSVQKDNYVAIRTANKQGYDLATDGDGIDLAYPDSSTRRGRVGHGVSKTLPTSDSQGVMDGYRIRKLTPKECWRLMGFDDKDFEKAAMVNSNTQLYKQAGNSIVVNILEGIMEELLNGRQKKQSHKAG